ncbi:DNAJ heat shock N-terminal domain-containing protein [Striga asiatica]|uniref:DNAJ heat shock N-terminal domain-containing protein n=1 Tax=Striga asiatica TaxID=4170 RepID=A0A5A7P4K3_STRAF|nr:DNAJ heat shock N-terminal domain-containing protein [Striga asiatica]
MSSNCVVLVNGLHIQALKLHNCFNVPLQKREDKKKSRALNVRPTPGAGDEDESLADYADLEIDSRVKLSVVVPDRAPKTTPVANISLSFHESGIGDGRTLSFDMVMIVPSLSMAMMRTMNGEKSNFQMRARSMKPSTMRIVMDTA